MIVWGPKSHGKKVMSHKTCKASAGAVGMIGQGLTMGLGWGPSAIPDSHERNGIWLPWRLGREGDRA
jgi:hypothetical protein